MQQQRAGAAALAAGGGAVRRVLQQLRFFVFLLVIVNETLHTQDDSFDVSKALPRSLARTARRAAREVDAGGTAGSWTFPNLSAPVAATATESQSSYLASLAALPLALRR